MASVVEHGSLSAAAKSQYVTVQAVSKSIADLERELGRRLLVRESRGVHPTPFGKAFSKKALGVIAGFDGLAAFARSYGERGNLPERLRLALNTPAFPGNEVVRENTAAFSRARLGMEVTCELATGESGFEGLADGTYDALVTVGAFRHGDVECFPVGTVPAGVMMSSQHPLARKDAVSLEDLAPYPIGLSSWFDDANDTIVKHYREQGARLGFVELALADVVRFLNEGGIVFTTGIPALGRVEPSWTVRMMAPEDATSVPICLVCLKDCGAMMRTVVEKLRLGDGGLSSRPSRRKSLPSAHTEGRLPVCCFPLATCASSAPSR